MSDDWALAQGTVDFRNEERRARHGAVLGAPPLELLVSEDADLAMVVGDARVYAEFDRACECEGVCECEP